MSFYSAHCTCVDSVQEGFSLVMTEKYLDYMYIITFLGLKSLLCSCRRAIYFDFRYVHCKFSVKILTAQVMPRMV